jgi:hypothetical protein
MRKATIGALVVLSLWGATSWQQQQSLPQWSVVLEHHMMNGTEQFSRMPLFTPQKAGLYRVSGYCSAIGQYNESGWSFSLIWTEAEGGGTNSAFVSCVADSPSPSQSNITIFSPTPGEPVLLTAESSGTGSSTYNAAYTIEQLQ